MLKETFSPPIRNGIIGARLGWLLFEKLHECEYTCVRILANLRTYRVQFLRRDTGTRNLFG